MIPVRSVLAAAFPKSAGLLRTAIFNALVSRAEWATLLLNALEAKSISPMQLGPLQTSQLIRHPDSAVSRRAEAVLAKLNAGSSPAKDDLVSRLRPEVEKPGDVAKGKEVFLAACAVCHKVGNQAVLRHTRLCPDFQAAAFGCWRASRTTLASACRLRLACTLH